jgi:uncharacterized protein (DUF305 family)
MRTRPALILTLITLLGTTACGDDAPEQGAAPEAGDAAVTLNDADVEFAQGMIAHHEQAIEMAEIALDPSIGAGPEVVDLATRIQAAQDPEIDLMTAWLTAAGKPVAMDTSEGHDMSSMEGMMTAEEMDELSTLTATEFDQRWLAMMIEHHEGAISQSNAVTGAGSNSEVRALADQIIATQQAEIDEMQALLQG